MRKSNLLMLTTVWLACSSERRPPASTSSVHASPESFPPASTPTLAWWLTVTFVPTDTVIETLPVRAIDPTWERASVLTPALLPPEAQADPSSLADGRVTFAHEGDFDGNAQHDRAVVGVYRRHNGEQGSFLLILKRVNGVWAKAHLEEFPGRTGFTGLLAKPDTVMVGDCMECDGWSELRWNGHVYAWVPLEPDDDIP